MRMTNLLFCSILTAASLAACVADEADDSYLEDGAVDGKGDVTGAYMKEVNEHLHRGSQPDEHWIISLTDPQVRAIPFRSVVNLRAENNDEKSTVERVGMVAHQIPVVDHEFPSTSQVIDFLEFATKAENQPVYVHCNAGKGRTGIMVGVYRMAVEGWSAQQAYDEARSFGVSASKLDYFNSIAGKLGRGEIKHYDAVR